MATYYINNSSGSDANPGSIGSPWKTCPGMVAHTGSGSLSPGDTVFMDSASTWVMAAGTQGLNITGGVTYIGNQWGSGTRAILRAGGVQSASTVRFNDHPSYPTIFSGFEVDTNHQVNNGIGVNHPFYSVMNGALKVIRDCIVHDNFSDTSLNQFTYGIIVSSNSNSAGTDTGFCSNVLVQNCVCYNTSRDAICLYTVDSSGSILLSNVTVRGCEAYNTGQDPNYGAGAGFLVKGLITNAFLEYNYAHNTKGAPIFISSNENNHFAGAGLSNIHIRYNIATTENGNGGIRIYSQASGSDPKDIRIYGNIVYNETTLGGLYVGTDNGNTINLRVYNNTFYNAPVVFQNFPATVGVFEFKNNLCIQTVSGTPLTDSGTKITTHSNNTFVSTSGTLVSSGANTYTSANLSSYESTALSTDPLFLGGALPAGFSGTYGSGLHPVTNALALSASSTSVGTAAVLPSPYTNSINSYGRPSSPDRGAYQLASFTQTGVVVTFSAPAMSPDLRLLEYGNLALSGIVDTFNSASGSSASPAVSVTTTFGQDIVVAGVTSRFSVTLPGAGFTQQILDDNLNLVEDKLSSPATVTAGATSITGAWIAQSVALKGLSSASIVNLSGIASGQSFPTVQVSAPALIAISGINTPSYNDQLGFATHFEQGWSPEPNLIPGISRTGAGWIRDDLFAGHWETSPGVYVIPSSDSAWMTDAHAHGLKITGILGPNGNYANNYDPVAMANLAVWIAQSGLVDALEVLNEPNNIAPFNQTGGLALYVTLLNSVYDAVHLSKPSVRVIGTDFQGSTELTVLGMGIRCDGIVYHPYAAQGNAAPETVYEPPFTDYSTWVKAVQTTSSLPIWETEWGVYGVSPTDPNFPYVSQASGIARRMLLNSSLGIQHSFIYEFKDDGTEYYGVVDNSSAPKPSYFTMLRLTSYLNGFTPAATVYPSLTAPAIGQTLIIGAGTWSFGAINGNNYTILLNGVQAGAGFGILIVNAAGSVYVKNSFLNWYLWNGSGYTQTSPPTGINLISSSGFTSTDFASSLLYKGSYTIAAFWIGNDYVDVSHSGIVTVSFDISGSLGSIALVDASTGNTYPVPAHSLSGSTLTLTNMPVSDVPQLMLIPDTTIKVQATTSAIVSISGILSASAVGVPGILTGTVSVQLSGVVTSETFGAANVSAPDTITLSGITSKELFGTLSFNAPSFPFIAGISSAETFGLIIAAPAGVIIDLIGISSAETFGTYSLSILISGIPSTQSFGTPSLDASASILIAGIPSSESLGMIHVNLQGVRIDLNGIQTAEIFGTYFPTTLSSPTRISRVL